MVRKKYGRANRKIKKPSVLNRADPSKGPISLRLDNVTSISRYTPLSPPTPTQRVQLYRTSIYGLFCRMERNWKKIKIRKSMYEFRLKLVQVDTLICVIFFLSIFFPLYQTEP
jgi:transposase